jgi:hypothetical protein
MIRIYESGYYNTGEVFAVLALKHNGSSTKSVLNLNK